MGTTDSKEKNNKRNIPADGGSNKESGRKRAFIMVSCIIAVICLAAIFMRSINNPQKVTASKTGFALDTIINIKLYKNGDSQMSEKLFNICTDAEKNIFSPTETDSELYKINHTEWTPDELISGDPKIIELSEDMFNVIALASEYYEFTQGRYNIACKGLTELWNFHVNADKVVPDESSIRTALSNSGIYGTDYDVKKDYTFTDSQGEARKYDYALILNRPVTFDLGSVAKGYITDMMRNQLKTESACCRSLLDLGGNICCDDMTGTKQDSLKDFSIEIDTSFLPEGSARQIISVSPGFCVVTSGKYQRCFDIDGIHYHHILDGVTGYPVDTELASVTVIGREACICDILSTVCFIVGEDNSLALLEQEGCDSVFIYDDGTVHRHLKN